MSTGHRHRQTLAGCRQRPSLCMVHTHAPEPSEVQKPDDLKSAHCRHWSCWQSEPMQRFKARSIWSFICSRAFMWDLRRGQPLLRCRESLGFLVEVHRTQSQNTRPASHKSPNQVSVSHDFADKLAPIGFARQAAVWSTHLEKLSMTTTGNSTLPLFVA